ncbi:hypothetical protein BDR06DRAFT_975947 [Suillus hirtellus]|nr:hypothetical protein BDR06DRAFT_975947 [Suillus hirtellus]
MSAEGYTFLLINLHIQAHLARNQPVAISISSENEAPHHSVPFEIHRVSNYIKRDLVIGSPLIYYSATNMAPHCPCAPKIIAAPIAASIPTPIIAAPIDAVASTILAPALIILIAVAAFTNPLPTVEEGESSNLKDVSGDKGEDDFPAPTVPAYSKLQSTPPIPPQLHLGPLVVMPKNQKALMMFFSFLEKIKLLSTGSAYLANEPTGPLIPSDIIC